MRSIPVVAFAAALLTWLLAGVCAAQPVTIYPPVFGGPGPFRSPQPSWSPQPGTLFQPWSGLPPATFITPGTVMNLARRPLVAPFADPPPVGERDGAIEKQRSGIPITIRPAVTRQAAARPA